MFKQHPGSVFPLPYTVFCLLYVVNGIIRERPFELGIFVVCTLMLFIYTAVNFGFTMTMGSEYTVKLVRGCTDTGLGQQLQ